MSRPTVVGGPTRRARRERPAVLGANGLPHIAWRVLWRTEVDHESPGRDTAPDSRRSYRRGDL